MANSTSIIVRNGDLEFNGDSLVLIILVLIRD